MEIYMTIFILGFSVVLGYLLSFLTNKSLRALLVYILIIFTLSLPLYYQHMDSKINLWVLITLIFQAFNFLRIMESRYELLNTRKRVTKNGLYLFLIATIFTFIDFDLIINRYFIYSFVFTGGLVLAIRSLRAKTLQKLPNVNTTDSSLPTVSVLIPARNEDEQLSDCIESVISSNYPKLEVIVLDDCSQDNSSEIIKSFAQKGVRFIQGETPKDNWLAKNQAYEALASSASGDWYIFMGVDVRLDTSTIRNMVVSAINNKKEMVCVAPIIKGLGFKDIFVPLRVYWESVLPKLMTKFPPVLSTFWLISESGFKELGGFGAVSQSVLPERYFAKKMMEKDKYFFIQSDEEIKVETLKNFRDQLVTSQRLLYPQIRKSYSTQLILSFVAFLWAMPYFYFIKSLLAYDYIQATIALTSLVPILFSFYLISDRQGINHKFLRIIFFPYLLIQELACLYISSYRYEFSEVIWKGRNVCYPTLKVIPRLPKV